MRLPLPLSRAQAVDEWGVVAKGIANGKSYIRLSKARPRCAAAPRRAAWPLFPRCVPCAERSDALSPLSTRAQQVDFVRPKDAAERHKDAAADEVTGEILAVVFKA